MTRPDPYTLRQAFGAFPSGVVAVAAENARGPIGIAASSFTSVSLDPALVSFSVANTSTTWPRLRTMGRLGLSVLADHHDAVCRQLAGPAEGRFQGLDLRTTERGAVLIADAVARFVGGIEREIEAGDHTIVLLRLHEVDDTGGGSPLIFHRSAFTSIHEPVAVAG
jgi:flavin reductase (DIM6/NTAB) family NADH-FMN oxidoreductase RutF